MLAKFRHWKHDEDKNAARKLETRDDRLEVHFSAFLPKTSILPCLKKESLEIHLWRRWSTDPDLKNTSHNWEQDKIPYSKQEELCESLHSVQDIEGSLQEENGTKITWCIQPCWKHLRSVRELQVENNRYIKF